MDKTARALLEKAAAKMKSLIEENNELHQKAAQLDRLSLAEDIALMQAAAGVISYEDLLDERDKLAESDEDLAAVKTAMKRYGPGSINITTVHSEKSTVRGDLNKTAAKEPDHLAAARLQLEEVSAALPE